MSDGKKTIDPREITNRPATTNDYEYPLPDVFPRLGDHLPARFEIQPAKRLGDIITDIQAEQHPNAKVLGDSVRHIGPLKNLLRDPDKLLEMEPEGDSAAILAEFRADEGTTPVEVTNSTDDDLIEDLRSEVSPGLEPRFDPRLRDEPKFTIGPDGRTVTGSLQVRLGEVETNYSLTGPADMAAEILKVLGDRVYGTVDPNDNELTALELLDAIYSWMVCWSIAPKDDLGQSVPEFLRDIAEVLGFDDPSVAHWPEIYSISYEPDPVLGWRANLIDPSSDLDSGGYPLVHTAPGLTKNDARRAAVYHMKRYHEELGIKVRQERESGGKTPVGLDSEGRFV